ncbi:MAG: molybdate ABC transporter permease subunit [Spirulinaceae cyanobacterium]
MSDLTPIVISLKTATLATIITFFLGIIAARYLLTTRGIVKGLLDGLLTSPLVLPPTVVGFLLLLLFGRNGPVGQLLQLLGVRVIFTWAATVIAATVVAFPLMYKTALGAFKQIDSNLLAAARTLGASEGKIFWWVMLPLAKPGLVAGTLLTFARALGEFGATMMVAGSIPGQTQTIPVAIFFAAESGAMDQALVWVVVTIAISLGVTMAVNFWSDAAINRGKGEKSYIELAVQSPLPSQQRETYPVELVVEIKKRLPGFYLDVSFDANQQPLGLLGASGAGKSLILRCIAGLESPDQGRIVLNGKVLFDSQQGINLPSRDRKVGFLFQNYALFPHLTVAQNISFGVPKGKSNLVIKQQVEAQLVAVQLSGLGNRYPHQLSGGQQQRVALARALASQPEVLLLDEPFSAADTYLRHQLEKFLLASLTTYQGATLFVTHNLEEAYRICSNLLVIEEGKVAARGRKEEIFEHPPSKNVAAVTGCKNFSVAVAVTHQEVVAKDWQCSLKVVEPIPPNLSYIGIRAHQLIFCQDASLENTFPCWLTATSETQHRLTLYLKLNQPPQSPQDYHLQAEVFKDKWATMKDSPFPWYIQLHPLRVILLPESNK